MAIDKPQLQIRRDTAANWQFVNPILLEGELGYVTDTANFKIGDGNTQWQLLGYYGKFQGLFVPGQFYRKGQYAEAADGFAYEARVNMRAVAQPVNGPNWRKTSWGQNAGGGGNVEGIPEGSSLISEWQPGEYGNRLNVVLFEDNLYYVTFDVARPFTSVDLLEEYDLGQWTLIGTGSSNTVDNTLVLLAEDGRRILDENGQPITVD